MYKKSKTRENLFKRKYFGFLKSGILILIILSIAVYISIQVGKLPGQSNLAQNLIATFIGLAVTIFVIDGLLRTNRNSNYKALNESKSNFLRFVIRREMLTLLEFFNTSSSGQLKSNLVENNDETIEKEFHKFIKNKEIDRKFFELSHFNLEAAQKIDTLLKDMEIGRKRIADGLKEIKPFPDPSIIKIVEEDALYFYGMLSVYSKLTNRRL